MNASPSVPTIAASSWRLGLRLLAAAALWPGLSAGAESLSLGHHAVLPGGTVEVPVVVNDATGLASLSVTVNFDPQLLSLEAVTNGALGSSFTLAARSEEGTVRVAAVRETALAAGQGALLRLCFRANPGALPGLSSAITLADQALGGQHGRDLEELVAITPSAGSVTVVSATQDINANGLPDWWEEFHFGGFTNANPHADSDGDGLLDGHEFLAGTNPNDPHSTLRIHSVAADATRVELTFSSVSGKTYQVEYSADLHAWQSLGDEISGTGELLQATFDPPADGPAEFYRLRLLR